MLDRYLHTLAVVRGRHLWLIAPFLATVLMAQPRPVPRGPENTIPTGFGPERYVRLWERNPFTLVTPVTAQAHASPFDKLVLVSWSQNGGHEVVFIQSTDTSEVQKVADTPNAQGLRLVEVHRNANPQAVEAILSNGTEQGPVRFRTETAAAAGAPGLAGANAPGDQAGAGAPVPMLGAPAPMTAPQPPVPNGNAAALATQRMNGGPQRPANQLNVPRVPTAADYRRRRVLPTPNTNLQPPGNPQAPANPNRDNQD